MKTISYRHGAIWMRVVRMLEHENKRLISVRGKHRRRYHYVLVDTKSGEIIDACIPTLTAAARQVGALKPWERVEGEEGAGEDRAA